ALVHQSGGGTGFSFSRLRPKNDVVRSTMGVASGPVSFMKLYDASTDVVKQGGTRRGANMGILRVDHPDILEFIACKDDLTQVTNFNISVAVTDAFMRAVEEGTSYALIHPRHGAVVGQLDAREVFRKIVHGAWKTGEPGVYFIDRANYYTPVPQLGSYEATNPCGEQPLLPYDVCNLGSINVGLFARDGDVDWDRLRTAVHLCTHFLDNVIDANRYPLAEIDALAKRIRRIGLGVMGWADLLVQLGLPYNSDEAVALGRKLMEFVDEEAKVASEKLAEQRGVFAEWERSIWGPDATCARGPQGERVRPMRRLRNCNLTTVAPTGTISIIAGCSSGIEPLFAVAFMRNQAGVLMPDVNEDFVRLAKQEGWYSGALMQRIAAAGHIHFDEVPAQWQRVFVTAHDVTPEWHIQMQAAFQEFTDSAISKTCNFANDATEEYVEKIYRYAYKLGCKGVTRRVETPLGTMYVNITEDDKGQPFEVFISLGKAGAPLMADVEAIGRLISLALRSGIPIREVYRQLRGISSDRVVGLGPNKVMSVPDAIGIAIEKWMQEKQGVQQDLLGGAVAPASAHAAAAEGTVSERTGEAQDCI